MNLAINNNQDSLLIKTKDLISVNLNLLASDLAKNLMGKEVLYYSNDVDNVVISTTVKLLKKGNISCDKINFTTGSGHFFDTGNIIVDDELCKSIEIEFFDGAVKMFSKE